MSRNVFDKIKFFTKSLFLKNNFSSKKYWELRYATKGDSGPGSYGELADLKSKFINILIDTYSLESCLEFGCGDGNNLQYYNFKKYLGLDVSKTAIELCIQKYSNDSSKGFAYYEQDFYHNLNQFFDFDVTLSSEVLFHLVEQSVYDKYLENLFQYAKKGVIIIAVDKDNDTDTPNHVYVRKFSQTIAEKFPNFKKQELDLPDALEKYRTYFHYFQKYK